MKSSELLKAFYKRMNSEVNVFFYSQPSRLMENWIAEFLSHVKSIRPKLIALHLQEVGGKTYEKSMEYVQEFIKLLCESESLADYNKIRVFLDEDYNSAEHFTVSFFFFSNSLHLLSIVIAVFFCV